MRQAVRSQNPVLKKLYGEKTPGKKNKYWGPVLGLKTHQSRQKTAQKPLKIDDFSPKLGLPRIDLAYNKNSPYLRQSEYGKRCFLNFYYQNHSKTAWQKIRPKTANFE